MACLSILGRGRFVLGPEPTSPTLAFAIGHLLVWQYVRETHVEPTTTCRFWAMRTEVKLQSDQLPMVGIAFRSPWQAVFFSRGRGGMLGVENRESITPRLRIRGPPQGIWVCHGVSFVAVPFLFLRF